MKSLKGADYDVLGGAVIQTQFFWTGGRELCSLLGQAAGCPLSGTRSANTWLGPDPNNYNYDIFLSTCNTR